MSENKSVPFYDMFRFCQAIPLLSEAFNDAFIISASVDRAKLTMNATVRLAAPLAPVTLTAAESAIAEEFGLNRVTIIPVYDTAEKKEKTKSAASVLMGRPIKKPSMPMSEVTLETGKVIVTGEVFAVTTRKLQKNDAWVLGFDITDHTNSLRVSKYMRDENAGEICASVKEGMYVTVAGTMHLNNYDGVVLEPNSIQTATKEKRRDTASSKRVELHLHTRMSAMDALTDTKKVVKRAIEWGHPAIAITDHGVAQSFPDAMNAAGDKIKILYGVEGYYVNDVDNVLAVYGGTTGDLGDDIVVFDLETTGLSSTQDAITEIGAVVMSGGKEVARFQTFVDPARHIPHEITTLTGITDDDVRGAPSQKEAVRAFLDFVDGRPLCGHNAGFDVGFIYEVCLRESIPFTPNYIDTLAMARALMPEMKSHKLNLVSAALGLPDFNHHR
ncbi:MAG: PHP domain-containing protein, partial [Oscillospiraceae bacterium]|nr:PHP domain-containing protein [Oscillospiraceae bacterium]